MTTNQDGIDAALTFLHLWLSQHLVCLSAVYLRLDESGERTGQQDVYAYTSFVHVEGDDWFLLTAGHVLDRIARYKRYPKGMIKIYLAGLGNLEAEVIHPVEFADFDEAPKNSVDDESAGLDYGWVYLRPYYRNFLRADGVRPVYRRDWAPLRGRHYDGQVLVGYPEDLLGETTYLDKSLARRVEPVILSVNEPNPLPADLEGTTYPRYIGRITPRAEIRVDGMSGGLIVAFGPAGAGEWKYWPVALQSTKNEGDTIVFGCPGEVFLPRMEREVQTAKRSSPHLFVPEETDRETPGLLEPFVPR